MTTDFQKMREQQSDIIAAQIEAADKRALAWKIQQEAIAKQKAVEVQAEIDRKALIKAAEDLLIANELEAKKKKEEEEDRRRREAQAASEPVQTPTPVATSTQTESYSAPASCDGGGGSDGGGCGGGDGGGSSSSCD